MKLEQSKQISSIVGFQNVNCFVFEQPSVRNIYNVYYFKTSSMCIFNTVRLHIGFIFDAWYVNFVYLHNLCTAVELHTNFVLLDFRSPPI